MTAIFLSIYYTLMLISYTFVIWHDALMHESKRVIFSLLVSPPTPIPYIESGREQVYDGHKSYALTYNEHMHMQSLRRDR